MAADHDDQRPHRTCSGDSWSWLPDRVDRRVIAAAWATLAVQVGHRRQPAASCVSPDRGWAARPGRSCTAESLVPTPEMGIHGVIEFGNRTADLRPRGRRDRDVPVRCADAPRASRPVLAGSGNRPVRAAAGGHRRHHGADQPQPVRRRTALLRVGRPRRARGGSGRPGLRDAGPARASPCRGWYAALDPHHERSGAASRSWSASS